ncbi:hypothetical protein BKM31_24210 [[Actinomadura] parvosata subsp. kistnae]|uniref:histidine kinase n=2 Tax=Nonomuraea TaxID=83681 RepID=A0A1V0A1T2_9ACTN|nr:hypothetical protein BKM31_24210 [Nonomuraea sp. ATCC 55076]
MAVVVYSSTAMALGNQPGARPLDVLGHVLLAVTVLGLAWWRRRPEAALAVCAGAAAAVFTLGYALALWPAPALIALFVTIADGRRRVMGWVGAAFLVAVPGMVAVVRAEADVVTAVILWTLIVLAVAQGGEASRARRAYTAEVERRAADAERTREEEALRRAQEERLRVARELHDVTSHTVSVIALHAAVAAEAVERAGGPPEAAAALGVIRSSSRQALSEMKAILGVLRTNGPNGPSGTSGATGTGATGMGGTGRSGGTGDMGGAGGMGDVGGRSGMDSVGGLGDGGDLGGVGGGRGDEGDLRGVSDLGDEDDVGGVSDLGDEGGMGRTGGTGRTGSAGGMGGPRCMGDEGDLSGRRDLSDEGGVGGAGGIGATGRMGGVGGLGGLGGAGGGMGGTGGAEGGRVRQVRFVRHCRLVEDDFVPQPGSAQLPRLIENAALPVTLDVEGERRTLPAAADLTVYRVVQEALTNTMRHAGATRASVTLTYEVGAVTVRVDDDGRGGRAPHGHGLTGMAERVAAVGGRLATGEAPGGGFRVTARLPA